MINGLASQGSHDTQAVLSRLDPSSDQRIRQLSADAAQRGLDKAGDMGQLLTILNAATFTPGLPLWAFGRVVTPRTKVASGGAGFGTVEAARDAAAAHFNGGLGFDAGLRAHILLRLEMTGEPHFDAELPERPTPALTPSFGT